MLLISMPLISSKLFNTTFKHNQLFNWSFSYQTMHPNRFIIINYPKNPQHNHGSNNSDNKITVITKALRNKQLFSVNAKRAIPDAYGERLKRLKASGEGAEGSFSINPTYARRWIRKNTYLRALLTSNAKYRRICVQGSVRWNFLLRFLYLVSR